MKREIPLFIIDTKRSHGLGDCDFIVCTDKENGFIAKAEFVANDDNVPQPSDLVRVSKNESGYSCVMEVKRVTGSNPSNTGIRTLMKKGMDLFNETMQVTVGAESPSIKQMTEFLDLLIRSNKHNLNEAGADYKARNTVLNSLSMLEHIKTHLNEE